MQREELAMSDVSAMTAVRSTPQRAREVLLTVARFGAWMSPELTLRVRGGATKFKPGDHFRVEVPGGMGFDYEVEVVSDREVVFSFRGPWSGRERWSFIADGAETIVRRVHDVVEESGVDGLLWRVVGRPLVAAHFAWEMARFRATVEREPGVRGEIEPRGSRAPSAGAAKGEAGASQAAGSSAAASDSTAPDAAAPEREREVPRAAEPRTSRETPGDVPRERPSVGDVERESAGEAEAEAGSGGPGFPVDEG